MENKNLFSIRSITIAIWAVMVPGFIPTYKLAWKFVVYEDTHTRREDHEVVMFNSKQYPKL